MVVRYGYSIDAYRGYRPYVENLLQRYACKRILEVGAGANPTLPRSYVEQHGLDYTVLDISADELAKAPEGYHKIQADIASANLVIDTKYDFVFSRMIAEHVNDAAMFHGNIHRLLESNGIVFHYFPTLYDLPYIVNMLMPEQLSYKLLLLMDKERANEGTVGKFPARYRMCYGPTKRQMRRMEALGYNILEYAGFFGNDYYYQKSKTLLKVHQKITRFLVNRPIALLTSYAYLVMRKNA